MHEGNTDQAYFNIIIPALMEDLIRHRGTGTAVVPQSPAAVLGKRGRTIEEVAREICEEREAFHLVFIHADTGGRSLEAGMASRSTAYQTAAFDLCSFPLARCVIVAPRHETESWMLADPQAVMGAMAYRGSRTTLGLPADAVEAERLPDPKQVLKNAVGRVRGRRSAFNVEQIIPAIAQRQVLGSLRRSSSFQTFEAGLFAALVDLGCVA